MNENKYDFVIGDTKNNDIIKASKNKYDVINQIKNSMLSDNENDSIHILEMYYDADEKERAIMDAMLVCICGYTMNSIIYLCEKHKCFLD